VITRGRIGVGRAILDGRVVHIEDVLADPELRGNPFQAAVRRAGGIRTDLGVPIRYDGQLIGDRSRPERGSPVLGAGDRARGALR
jgi:hypothetical protein